MKGLGKMVRFKKLGQLCSHGLVDAASRLTFTFSAGAVINWNRTARCSLIPLLFILFGMLAPSIRVQGQGALAGDRHRVVISTDIGGTDPDDFQSMVHLLLYADVLDIEGLISSPYGPGRKGEILKVIDAYAQDYPNLKTYSDQYPYPESLRAITKQGETEVAPLSGVRRSTEGSNWIIQCAKRDDLRPLHVLVWGGLEDLTQALHDAPEIVPELRVYWIGGPNKKWGPSVHQYLVDHYPELWIIEANSTYRGWFVGGDQSGEWGNKEFVKQHVADKGALGTFFNTQLGGSIKMGDTPSVAWLLRGDPSKPSKPGWGGQFVYAWERPYLRSAGLTTTDDRMEIFGVLELVFPLGQNPPENPMVQMDVENQNLKGEIAADGTIRIRFCPKAAKTYTFRLKSNVPALNGKSGGITSVHPRGEVFSRRGENLPNWWTDNQSLEWADGEHRGTRTVNRWRKDFLTDFSERMLRCEKPYSESDRQR